MLLLMKPCIITPHLLISWDEVLHILRDQSEHVASVHQCEARLQTEGEKNNGDNRNALIKQLTQRSKMTCDYIQPPCTRLK